MTTAAMRRIQARIKLGQAGLGTVATPPEMEIAIDTLPTLEELRSGIDKANLLFRFSRGKPDIDKITAFLTAAQQDPSLFTTDRQGLLNILRFAWPEGKIDISQYKTPQEAIEGLVARYNQQVAMQTQGRRPPLVRVTFPGAQQQQQPQQQPQQQTVFAPTTPQPPTVPTAPQQATLWYVPQQRPDAQKPPAPKPVQFDPSKAKWDSRALNRVAHGVARELEVYGAQDLEGFAHIRRSQMAHRLHRMFATGQADPEKVQNYAARLVLYNTVLRTDTPPSAENLIAALDTNNSGYLSADEWTAAYNTVAEEFGLQPVKQSPGVIQWFMDMFRDLPTMYKVMLAAGIPMSLLGPVATFTGRNALSGIIITMLGLGGILLALHKSGNLGNLWQLLGGEQSQTRTIRAE